MTDLDRLSKDDPFLLQYQPSELRVAAEFLTTWIPFLSRDLCRQCTEILSDRIRSLDPEVEAEAESSYSDIAVTPVPLSNCESHDNGFVDNCDNHSSGSWKDEGGDDVNSLGSWKDAANGCSGSVLEASTSVILGASPLIEAPRHKMSWADMAQEDEFLEEEEEEEEERELKKRVVSVSALTGEMKISKDVEKPKLSTEQREYIRFMSVKRKKDFICLERVKGKIVNILEGLELHSLVFSAAEQRRIVNYVHELHELGSKGKLNERTYTAPKKGMRGKGRVTIQFGGCYNYATDKNGNPSGILLNEVVDPIPNLFKVMIRRLIGWHVLPPTCVPDSCIVNIYDEGDCIPPHIDNHDFLRPFCTVSFVSECNMVFGSNLEAVSAGEFTGSIAIPLPVGSVLVLNGNAADVSKHCVPSVPSKRISITFRKMDEAKRPIGFVPEPDLQGIEPLVYDVDKTRRLKSPKNKPYWRRQPIGKDGKNGARVFRENGFQSELHYYTRENGFQSERHYSTRSGRGSANKWRVR